ncbi:MAG: ribosome small subunit-dependent GTPase A [Anaerolineaceae bacterium]|nr:ribosome small subunit-dependent GTPase A [Anaerolineaceae bacterium]
MSSKDKQDQIDRYVKGMNKSTRRQQLQKANKKMRRNQASKKARRKDWIPGNLDVVDDWDELEEWDDYEDSERIMPRDEGERRRAVESVAFQPAAKAEADEGETAFIDDEDTLTGMVVEVSKGLFRVQVDDQTLLCSLRGNLSVTETGFTNAAAVGDQVIVRVDGAGGGVIEAVLPRRSLLARPDTFYSHLQQIIVANVDQLLVVSSWREPHIWLELVDRYLIVAERNHIPAVLCVNKIDLLQDPAELAATLRPYRDLGYTVVVTSTVTGAGIEQLRALLADQTTVLAGLSGVGKSSLISAAEPGLNLRTSHISDKRQEGRHTTTQATWHPLAAGGAVVDTPGIREFGLSGLYQADLIGFMPDLEPHAAGCRFNNCLHMDEPDCAVRAAVENGQVAASRYDSYKQILSTLPA